jgi:hypothetical protein
MSAMCVLGLCVKSLGFSTWEITLSMNRDNFTSFFLTLIPFFFFLEVLGIANQGLVLARNMLYHLSHNSSPNFDAFYFFFLLNCSG